MKAILLACCLAVAGCGTADPFVGSWRCAGNQTITYTSPEGMAPQSASVSGTNTVTDNGSGVLTIVRTPSDGPTCTVTAQLAANKDSFTWEPDQTCMNSGGATVDYSFLNATLTETGYTTEYVFTVSGTGSSGPITGTGSGTSTCTKS